MARRFYHVGREGARASVPVAVRSVARRSAAGVALTCMLAETDGVSRLPPRPLRRRSASPRARRPALLAQSRLAASNRSCKNRRLFNPANDMPVVETALLRWIVLCPLIGTILCLIAAKTNRAALAKLAGPLSVLAAFAFALVTVGQLLQLPPEGALLDRMYTWIHATPLTLEAAFRVDHLTSVMILIITGVGFLIHVYSLGYMHDDPDVARFFAYLNLFTTAMLILVLGDSLPMMFIGWEGVGLCSYLLIGFWYLDEANADAGRKAFIANRIGDAAFLVGMFLLFWSLGQVDSPTLVFADINRLAPQAGGVVAGGGHGRLPAAVHRRHRQVGADSAVRLAARRDGRPDAGLGADPRRHHGDRRRLHDRPPVAALRALAGDVEPRRHHRCRHRVLRGDHRPRAARPQEDPRLLDRLAARLHVPRPRLRRLLGGDLPSDDARLLQGAACSSAPAASCTRCTASSTSSRWAA